MGGLHLPLGRPYRAEPALAFVTQGVALGLTIQAFQAGGPYTEATSEREKMYKLQGTTVSVVPSRTSALALRVLCPRYPIVQAWLHCQKQGLDPIP